MDQLVEQDSLAPLGNRAVPDRKDLWEHLVPLAQRDLRVQQAQLVSLARKEYWGRLGLWVILEILDKTVCREPLVLQVCKGLVVPQDQQAEQAQQVHPDPRVS